MKIYSYENFHTKGPLCQLKMSLTPGTRYCVKLTQTYGRVGITYHVSVDIRWLLTVNSYIRRNKNCSKMINIFVIIYIFIDFENDFFLYS